MEHPTPTIHLNGSGAANLLADYRHGAAALRDALDRLPVPHARDYYVQGDDAYLLARKAHERHAEALRTVYNELREVAVAIQRQRSKR